MLILYDHKKIPLRQNLRFRGCKGSMIKRSGWASKAKYNKLETSTTIYNGFNVFGFPLPPLPGPLATTARTPCHHCQYPLPPLPVPLATTARTPCHHCQDPLPLLPVSLATTASTPCHWTPCHHCQEDLKVKSIYQQWAADHNRMR